MTEQHTPGEWKRSGLTIIGPHPKGDGRDRVIARCEHAPGTYIHEAIANSDLISAAPDLMEQHEWNKRARDSVDALLAEAGFTEDSSVRHQLACMNFDALAKARGEK